MFKLVHLSTLLVLFGSQAFGQTKTNGEDGTSLPRASIPSQETLPQQVEIALKAGEEIESISSKDAKRRLELYRQAVSRSSEIWLSSKVYETCETDSNS